MKTRKLCDIEVSAVGMGCMAFSHGYGKIPDEEYSIDAIQNAYRHGCTFFDTAEVYSPNLSGIGHNELIVFAVTLKARLTACGQTTLIFTICTGSAEYLLKMSQRLWAGLLMTG